MRANPYLFGPPVSGAGFFGRLSELGQLEARVARSVVPAPCSIVGETRIGKSSLINEFIERARAEYSEIVILHYDVSSCFQAGNTIDFYRQFIALVRDDLSRLPNLDHIAAQRASEQNTPYSVMVQYMKAFFRSVKQAGFRLIIVLDEFDFMTEHFKFNPQGWLLLRSLGSDPPYSVCFITASRRSIEVLESDAGISSNFAGIFGNPIRLGLMTDEEARSLVLQPARNVGAPWEQESLVDVVLAVSGCHPYCLQMTCFHLFEAREQALLPDLFDLQWLLNHTAIGYRRLFALLQGRLEASGLFSTLLNIAHGVPIANNGRQLQDLVDLGYIVPISDSGELFKPFSLALDHYLMAYARGIELWPLIEKTELALRHLVETQYEARFGRVWQEEIRARNPGSAANKGKQARLGMVEGWEDRKRKDLSNPFVAEDLASSLLDYSYIGELKQLIDQNWEQFRDKVALSQAELRKQLEVLVRVRNPKAHYRQLTLAGAVQAEEACRSILAAIAG